MIKIDKTEIIGWEAAIRGMRNPMNSWLKSDSLFFEGDTYHDICENCGPCPEYEEEFDLGFADHNLMMTLASGGPVHAKYRRMIVVYVDITAPLYWWKEFDTYKVGTVANSCSTMHKIQAKEFVREDFSLEHLAELNLNLMDMTIRNLNIYREKFLASKDKEDWWQMIQLLPSSYNQKRTVMLNYEVLAGIYPMRKNHKLDEWHVFCDWIKELPYSELIIGDKETVTWQQVFEDFEKRYPEYFKHFVDYRPTDEPFTIQIWLDVTNAVTGRKTITYNYVTKRISL